MCITGGLLTLALLWPELRRAALTPGASVLQGRTAAGRGGCPPPSLGPRVPQQGLLSLLLDPADLLLEGAHLLLLFELLPHPSDVRLEGADVLLPAPNPQAARIRARVGLHLVPGGEPKEFALAVCQELGQEVLSGRDEVAAVGAPSREVAVASENLDVRVVSVHVHPDVVHILQLLDPEAPQADDGAAPLLSQGHGEPVAAVRAASVAAVFFRSLAGDPGACRSHRFSQRIKKEAPWLFWSFLRGIWGGLAPVQSLSFFCASGRLTLALLWPELRRAALTPGASVLQGRTAAGRGGCPPPSLGPRVPQQGLLSLLLDPADLLLEGAHLLLLFELLPHPSDVRLEGADVLLPAPNPQAARIRARVGLHLVPGGEPKEFALAVCQELGQEVLSGRDEVAAVGAPWRGQSA
ncbi:hypothetical protein C7M84_016685 [Penaeus vannamei]|uniref:Uncharacterized protein n=1 Tax=Penaeus vannamei TaxID=6689 RepID=A0A423SMC5_PENVA|nr:hypothetical protein C7M84_016685 [Penaeus vannamei]